MSLHSRYIGGMRTFCGLILAGGRGRRFGEPKAFAALPDGRSFLDSCFECLHQAGARPVLACLPSGVEGKLPPGLLGRSIDPDLDMFGSIRLGLENLLQFDDWSAVVILPVDHPLVSQHTIRRLARTEAAAAIATYRNHHGHPVLLERAVASGLVGGSIPGPTLREVLRAAEAVDVEVEDPQTRSNCNTPETLERAWRIRTGTPEKS